MGNLSSTETYDCAAGTPAIRTATREAPWRCPWCGANTWFVLDEDNPLDGGRVQMYCDNSGCDSRETDLLAMRGHDENGQVRADRRADVRALRRIDNGALEGREPLESYRVGNPNEREILERRERRIMWRQPVPVGFETRANLGGSPVRSPLPIPLTSLLRPLPSLGRMALRPESSGPALMLMPGIIVH